MESKKNISHSKKRKRSPTRMQPPRKVRKDHVPNDNQKENEQKKYSNFSVKDKDLSSVSRGKVVLGQANKKNLDYGELASTQNIPVKQLLNDSQPTHVECNISNRFSLESGHKRKRDHDDSLFTSMNIRPLSIVLDRINISKIRSNKQSKTNENIASKGICTIDEKPAQPQNKRIGLPVTKKDQINEKQVSDEETSIPSTRKQPSRKAKVASIVSEETKSKKSNNRNTGTKNKVVPFEKTKLAKEFVPGEIVLAHVTGYCDWPAFIKSVHGHILVVEFFGTGQVNPLRSDRIKDFNLEVAKRLLNRKGFKKAMKELEMCLKIPPNESIVY